MYPTNYFSLFPPFPREDKIFVAMSFDKKFDPRWNNVILPAIKNIQVNEKTLEPIRVDTRLVSDSILTEILAGISNSRLVFVDMTTIGVIDGKAIRNGNVMYELGMAQSIRLPEEVILFRSDSDQLLFDTSSIRVNKYDPDYEELKSKQQVEDTIISALKEIDLCKHLAVKKATEVLDEHSYWLLFEAMNNPFSHPRNSLANSMRIHSINKLLELGAISTDYLNVTPKLFSEIADKKNVSLMKYKITEFGIAITHACVDKLGFQNPELIALLESRLETEDF
jgi:hypothetical protein